MLPQLQPQAAAFVGLGNSTNMGKLQAPACTNPTIVTTCFVYGNQIRGPNSNMPVVVSFPYDAGCIDLNLDGVCDAAGQSFDNPSTHALMVPANQVGTTWGIAYDGASQQIFTAAFLKRHTGFGPSGPGAIYRIDQTTGNATTFWTVNAGVDPHPQPLNEFNCPGAPSNYCWFYDQNTVGQIGKMSLGGLDISDDQKNLFVMNLFDRRLYQIDVATATTVTSYPFPLNQGDCTGDPDDIRPFAVRVHLGLVYVGAVCTAESLATQANDNPNRRLMRLYVYAIDPAAAAPTFTQVFNYNPIGGVDTYRRDRVWRRWTSIFPQPGGQPCDFCTNPQPWLTGIAFDDNGDMVLAIRDRFGDQGGYRAGSTTVGDPGLNTVAAAGDTLRACTNGAGGWVMENNGTCGGVTTAGAGVTTPGTAGGPYVSPPIIPGGVGKYYFQDNHDTGPSVSMGAVLQIPGQPEIMITAIDPKYGTPGDPGTSSAGTLRFNNRTAGTAGTRQLSYRIYREAITPAAFGKANGLGDLKALCPVTLVPTPTLSVTSTAVSVSIAAVTSNLAVSKKADQTIVQPGENVTYTITVNNQGSTPATNVVINDPVPAPLVVLSATALQGTFTIVGNTVTFLVGTVNPGQTVTLTISANVPSSATTPQDVYNIIISDGGVPLATEAIHITRSKLPNTGEQPDAGSGWLWAMGASSGLVLIVLLLRIRRRNVA